MTKKASQRHDSREGDAIRAAARMALSNMLEPLAGFVVDAGLSAHDFQALFRDAMVRSVRNRQHENANRVSISGIAATTGIPRAEISRILRMPPVTERYRGSNDNQATNQILSVWHKDPLFTSDNGTPLDLAIYGRVQTFEVLVKRYGRGIPTRAMLDELVRSGAIEVLSSQKVRARSSVAVNTGVSARAVKVFGERASELLSSMLVNMCNPSRSHFVASIEGEICDSSEIPLFRKEVASKGADFLAEIQDDFFNHGQTLARKLANKQHRASVTLYCHEAPPKRVGKAEPVRRRNFRRVPKV